MLITTGGLLQAKHVILKLMKDAAKPESANVQSQQPDFSRVHGGDDDEKKHALDRERFALTLTRAPSVVRAHLLAHPMAGDRQ